MHVDRATMEHCQANEEDCEGLVNYALAIEGIEVALFFRELPDGCFRVSLRSKGAVNVAAVAEEFGGGGHEAQADARWRAHYRLPPNVFWHNFAFAVTTPRCSSSYPQGNGPSIETEQHHGGTHPPFHRRSRPHRILRIPVFCRPANHRTR